MNSEPETSESTSLEDAKAQLVEALKNLPSDEDRGDVLRFFCWYCGANDPRCQCSNDE